MDDSNTSTAHNDIDDHPNFKCLRFLYKLLKFKY